jgi:hypothetical protein
MTPEDFTRQQAAVIRDQALRSAMKQIDTTAVIDALTYLIPNFTAGSVVSNALTDALMAIEQDIDRHMGSH